MSSTVVTDTHAYIIFVDSRPHLCGCKSSSPRQRMRIRFRESLAQRLYSLDSKIYNKATLAKVSTGVHRDRYNTLQEQINNT